MNYLRKNVWLVYVFVGLMSGMATSYAASAKSDTAVQAGEPGSPISVIRSGSVGSGVFVTLSIDGKYVKTLLQGRHYQGTLSPGKHVISVKPDPNTTGQKPNQVEVMVEKGRSYSFSASRNKSGEIVLVKNS
jgi:hypothetical protein